MKARHLVFSAAFAALLFIYFDAVLLLGNIFAERDMAVFFYPYIDLWVNSLRQGELPLWNPYIMCGEPLLAAVQPGPLYPPNLLYLLFSVATGFNLGIVLHFFLAGAGMFMLMKETRASDDAAAIAALVFVFGGYLLSVHNVLTTLQSVAWFPLAVMLFLRSVQRGSRREAVLCGLVLYCMFSGGGLEIFLMAVAVLAVLAVVPYLYSSGMCCEKLLRRLGLYLTVLVVFVGVGAVQLLPFLELMQHSIRAGGLSYDEAVIWSFAPANIINFFAPDIFWRGPDFYWLDQSWLKVIYIGFLPLMCSCFFWLETGRRRLLVALFIVCGIFLCLGKYNPLYAGLYEYLPVLKKIRFPVKFIFVCIFFFCLSAGWGWDYLKQHLESRLTQRVLFGLFFLFGFCAALLLLVLYRFPDAFWQLSGCEQFFSESLFSRQLILHNIRRVIFFGIIGSTAIYVAGRNEKIGLYSSYGFMMLLLVDLFWGNYGHYTSLAPDIFNETTNHQRTVMQDSRLSRIYVQPKIIKELKMPYNDKALQLQLSKQHFVPNLLMTHGRFDVWGFSVLALEHYREVLSILQRSDLPNSTRLGDMLNVGYVLWSEQLDLPGYELVVANGRTWLYENTRHFPRAWLVPEYQVEADRLRLLQLMERADFDPARQVLLSAEPAPAVGAAESLPALEESVALVRYGASSFSLEVVSSRRQFLATSETWYPGWKAFVDGREVPLYQANGAFRAIAVPPGSYRVRFVYDPPLVKIGAGISLLSLVLAVLFLCSGVGKKSWRA
ncbi:MAG: YfhO family protein [Deltaproteobacteria bacterium]|nr:YfhO family protein [Deltaproteobacteria bacterium]